MNFEDFYRNVNTPVIVYCEDTHLTVVYENRSAIMKFNPITKNKNWDYIEYNTPIASLLQISKETLNDFLQALNDADGNIPHYNMKLKSHSNKETSAFLAANRFLLDGKSYVAIFVNTMLSDNVSLSHAQALVAAVEVGYKAGSTDQSINNILAFAGNYIDVSRAYIFESISETTTSNTYEWCRLGVPPAIQDLKNLPKEEYSYDKIIENGLAVTDDIRKLPLEDQMILGPQGIKSLAILPIYYQGTPLGYVGFDDCIHYREWTSSEIEFLKSLAEILAFRLIRRNSEKNMQYSLDVLNTVTDNTDNLIFVVDQKGDFLFANSAVARAINMSSVDIAKKNAKKVLEIWTGPLQSDNFRQQIEGIADEENKTLCWEFHNLKNDRWYLVRCSIITWIDGFEVYLLTLTEITGQKKYEAKLKHVASTDTMTGLYNRNWALQLLTQILENNSVLYENSLVFIDLDSLKKINDKFGHDQGDAMILRTVELIQKRIRKSDSLCRWGGDEFLLITRANERQTSLLMEDILNILQEHNASRKDIFTVSFSYGVVEIKPTSGQTVDSIIKEADKRMYAYKMGQNSAPEIKTDLFNDRKKE